MKLIKPIKSFENFSPAFDTNSMTSNNSSGDYKNPQVSVRKSITPLNLTSNNFLLDMNFCMSCENDSLNNNSGITHSKKNLNFVKDFVRDFDKPKNTNKHYKPNKNFLNTSFYINLEKLNKIRKESNKELEKIITNDELSYDEARFEIEQKYTPQAAKLFPDIFSLKEDSFERNRL